MGLVGLSEIENQILISMSMAKNYTYIDLDILRSHQHQFFLTIASGMSEALKLLIQKKLLLRVNQGSSESYILTPEGIEIAKELTTLYMEQWYSRMLKGCAESEAHKKLCLKTCGIDFQQFSFLTARQFEWVINLLKQEKATRILDVGCGTGGFCAKLAEYPEFKWIHGIDFAKDAIEYGKKRHAQLKNVLLEAFPMEGFQGGDSYDAIVFIDTIYFTEDPRAILEKYLDRLSEQGSLLIFFAQPEPYVQKFEKVLAGLNLPIYSKDFTEEFAFWWDEAAATLIALHDEFCAEGHEYFHRAYLAEAERNIANRRGPQVRKFYQIKKSAGKQSEGS